ncbi:glycoside hydrolase family 31 protein [Rhodophyticola sp.]|jgi:alpha-D-xyloside xylohydrolase|uniref:glycoside hydrolase family 31 protein n=1 Tax=Rhodophyticola sp. TaxID=2680032 RepID=UPI003D2E25A9
MQKVFSRDGDRIVARHNGETLWLDPIGPNGMRLRATKNARIDMERPGALLETLPAHDAAIDLTGEAAILTNGRLRAELRLVPRGMGPAVELRVSDRVNGALLLEEEMPHILWPGTRHHSAEAGDLWAIETRFAAQDGERFHGLGQHQHGRFDLKGCVLDLMQKNTEITIPFLISSRGYGVLWNAPGVGRVELAENRTKWVMEATKQLDYIVIAGAGPADLLTEYTGLTGRPPELPDWALGFWQCKLRYETQEEVLRVARGYKARGLPLDCIVIDFFHWTKMGEWTFRSDEFPDPAAMVAELRDMGVAPMVSVWPTVNANADTYGTFLQNGWLVDSRRGAMDGSIFYDREPDGMNPLRFYDATNPEARAFHWQHVREGYARHGIHAFWLDANEPEMYPMHPDNLRFHLGDGRDVANIYAFLHQQGYAEAFAADGLTDGLMLSRSAWAGSQRFPLVVWSGDVRSSFADLARQLTAGLNMALSGISWWTTDIGGFKGGDIGDAGFRELLIRWFQWGAFCPIFRLHGFRQDAARDPRFGHEFSFGGADNEIWSFGPEVESILTRYLHLRAGLRPYLRSQMAAAAARGIPPMRPLMVDFPDDPVAATIADCHMLGPDLLVAPVLEAGAETRRVYLPDGTDWICMWTGTRHAGGQRIEAPCPLERIPVYRRAEAEMAGFGTS